APSEERLVATRFAIDRGAACNSVQNLLLVTQSSGLTFKLPIPIVVGRGAEGRAHADSGHLGMPVPDNDPEGLVTHVTVGGGRQYVDGPVKIAVDIRHPYRADLVLTLISPQGTAIRFFDRVRGNPDIRETFEVGGFEREPA